jgi:hypothetical protein
VVLAVEEVDQKPLKNILFFAAWPMLAALLTLFLLRSHDRMASLNHRIRDDE